MSPRQKWLTVIGASLGSVGVACILAYWLAMPAYVEDTIGDALQERGFNTASFSLESVSLSALTIRNLQLDQARTLTVGRVEVDYDLADLREGRVRAIRLFDATLRVRISSEHVPDWGPLAELGKRGKPGPPPLTSLHWINSLLIVETPEQTIRVPLCGSLDLVENVARIALHGELFDEPMHVYGSAHYNARSELQSGQLRGQMASDGNDRLSLEARFKQIQGDTELTLAIAGKRRSLHFRDQHRSVALQDLIGNLRVRILGDELLEASGEISAAMSSSNDLQLAQPRLAVHREGDILAIEMSGRVEELEASVRGELSPFPERWTADGPFETRWQLEGEVPESLGHWLADAGMLATRLRLVEASGRALIARADDGWRASISDGSAMVALARLRMPARKLTIGSAIATLRFGAIVDEAGGELSVYKGTQGSAGSIRWGTVSLKRARRSAPALTLQLDDDAVFRWDRESTKLKAEQISVNLRSHLQTETAELRNLRGALKLSLTPRGERQDLRILWSRLRSGRLRWGAFELPNLSARLRGRPAYLRIEASSRITKTATLSVESTIDQRRRQGRCPTRVRLPQARIQSKDRLALLIQSLVPISLAGGLELDAQADLCAPTLQADGKLRLVNLRASDLEGSAALSGIHGSIAFSGPNPTTIREWQELAWKKTKIGERSFGRGALTFRSRSPGTFEVREAMLELGGGKISTSSFELNPKKPQIETTVFASGLSLQKWLPVLSRQRARGRGRLSGKLHARLQWKPQLQLKLFQGNLHATGRGFVAVTDRSWLRSALERYAAGFGGSGDKSDLIKDRLIGALMDFGYTKLSATILPGRPPILRVKTKGKGRQIPQELDLTLNVTGFEDLLSPGLRAWLGDSPGRNRK